ncbi:MAG: 4-hydroxy-3-methylbut-2-enyl diphosphate reductase [Spirochaetales bacterium]|nr:4-hydroxy-3-methylbut-2-enyl diphosphate reductase [Spirochaetales bacterium]
MKQIFLSEKCGFCMGVKNAFTKSLACSETMQHLCCYGEIVHNKFALQQLTDRNIMVENDIDSIISSPDIENVIIRAHGIPPSEEMSLRQTKNVIDLTCPNVKKVQNLAKSLAEQDFFIIILGKANHPEVKGICGYCEDHHIVVRNLAELEAKIDSLHNCDKLAFISQTTANYKDFDSIAEYLTSHYPNVEIHRTLCFAPIAIQNASVALAKNVDLMIIIGDRQSANTTTLYNLCSEHCRTVFAETPTDLSDIDWNGIEKIGISAGSSTPESQIKTIKEYLNML